MSILEILLVASILPSALLMMMVYKNDKVEKEPENLLIKTFLLGIVSAIIAIVAELTLGKIVAAFVEPGTALYTLIEAFIIVALMEEVAKFIMLKTASWKDKNFNYTFDAIVYAVFTSLGFATIENILYVLSNGFLVAIIRAISAVPAHMTFGVFMGIYYGKAKVCEKNGDIKGKKYNLIKSVLIPTVLHGLYDYCLMESMALSLIIFVVLLVFLYINMFRNIKKYSKEDTKIQFEGEVTEKDSEKVDIL